MNFFANIVINALLSFLLVYPLLVGLLRALILEFFGNVIVVNLKAICLHGLKWLRNGGGMVSPLPFPFPPIPFPPLPSLCPQTSPPLPPLPLEVGPLNPARSLGSKLSKSEVEFGEF